MSSKDFASIGQETGKLMPEAFQREVNSRIEARDAARKSKNFAEADRIRDELLEMGVVLHDTKDGTTKWEPSLLDQKKATR